MFRCLRLNKYLTKDNLGLKLQRRLNRKVGKKEYSKWVVVLSAEDVEKAGWKEGDDLKADVKDGDMILSKTDND